MPLLDIENSIASKEIGSRFRLVSLASQRARELNAPREDTLPQQTEQYAKVTTNALAEITEHKISFKEEENLNKEG